MSGYIPTEDEVETAFSTFAAELAIEFPGEYPDAPEFATIQGASAGFYRWLDQVKADAWDEGAAKGAAYGDTAISLNPMHANPYREANDDE